jgi:hypothetical protein
MNVYLLDDPATPAEFARFSHVGTWANDRVCEACGEPTSRLIEPLQIEWDEGTDRVGDFSWGGYHCVVIDAVQSFLKSNAFEADFGRVQVMPATLPAVRPRVSFPYLGPHVSWLNPTARLELDEDRSRVQLVSDCSVCGQKRYTFRREGLVVPRNAWSGEKMFLIEQFGRSRATFVTEDALTMLTRAGFSNLLPRLAGEIET